MFAHFDYCSSGASDSSTADTSATAALQQLQQQPWELSAELLRAVYALGTAPRSNALVHFLDKTVLLQVRLQIVMLR
jgi:hypothetical protein